MDLKKVLKTYRPTNEELEFIEKSKDHNTSFINQSRIISNFILGKELEKVGKKIEKTSNNIASAASDVSTGVTSIKSSITSLEKTVKNFEKSVKEYSKNTETLSKKANNIMGWYVALTAIIAIATVISLFD